MTEQDTALKEYGLFCVKNITGTCWLSVILQMLTSCPLYIQHIKQTRHAGNEKRNRLIELLIDTIDADLKILDTELLVRYLQQNYAIGINGGRVFDIYSIIDIITGNNFYFSLYYHLGDELCIEKHITRKDLVKKFDGPIFKTNDIIKTINIWEHRLHDWSYHHCEACDKIVFHGHKVKSVFFPYYLIFYLSHYDQIIPPFINVDTKRSNKRYILKCLTLQIGNHVACEKFICGEWYYISDDYHYNVAKFPEKMSSKSEVTYALYVEDVEYGS